jgi:hypothetical protein
MRHRVEHVPSEATLADVLRVYVTDRGLDPAEVVVGGGHARFDTPETDVERERREEHERAAAERKDAWEREAYARIRPRAIAEGWPEP